MIRQDKPLKYRVFVFETRGYANCALFGVVENKKFRMGFWPRSEDHENDSLRYYNVYITERRVPKYGDVIIDGSVARRFSVNDPMYTTDVVVACTDKEHEDIMPGVEDEFMEAYARLHNAEELINTVSLVLDNGAVAFDKAKVVEIELVDRDKVYTDKPVRFYDDRNKDGTIYLMKDILYQNENICLCSINMSEVDKEEINRLIADIKVKKTELVRAQKYEESARMRDKEHQLNRLLEGIDANLNVILFDVRTGECLTSKFQYWYAENYD